MFNVIEPKGVEGVGGILISVAKLVLTTLCAGIHPSRTLPVVLDCGTDVSQFRNDLPCITDSLEE